MPRSRRAAGFTWNTNGTATDWNTASDWTSGTVPASGSGLVFGADSSAGTLASNVLNNDILSLSTSGITFTSAAPAYAISGSSLTLTGNLTNSSTNLQTINLPLSLTTTATVTTTSGGGNFTLAGNIGGVGGGITTAGAGMLILGGTDSYTGLTTAAANTTVQLGAGGSINSGNALTTIAGGVFDINGNTQTLGLLTNGGTVTSSSGTGNLTIGNGSTGTGTSPVI